MFRLIEVIRYIRQGFCPMVAWRRTDHIKLGVVELTVYLVIVTILLFWFAVAQFSDYAARHGWRYQALKKQTAYYRDSNVQLSLQVIKLERILVGCLNGAGVIVNGRNKDCVVREYKG